MGYTDPTGIQDQVIPSMLESKDLVGQAQTGTGKTAAFGIPLSEMIDTRERGVQALVMVPTRELAQQVSNELLKLGRTRGIRICTVYGGQPIDRQIRELDRGVNIVVGTPGRMLDHLRRGTLDLGEVRIAVLDEADEMLDIGFAPDIESILGQTPNERQTVLFSATMPNSIRRMVSKHLKNPLWVRIGGEAQTVEAVKQVYYEVAIRDRNASLEEIIRVKEKGQSLIFCRTQRGVEKLATYLDQRGYPVEAIHGGLNQSQRNRAMQAFRSGTCDLLVATNVAARGLDIPAVSQVVNYDSPQNVEEYVHRIGRTARMGREGAAITFVSEWDFETFEPIRRHLGKLLERGKLSIYYR
jgi:ATP-dependent RNA helicase DeaD